MIVVVMGVSGCGKTTVGKRLSEEIGIPFFDGDDFHPKANVAKMASGIALDDQDRLPWLASLATKIEGWSEKSGAILACSALKENYRSILASKYKRIFWVCLSGSEELIKQRIEKRNGHFMKSDLLKSQFSDLEVPKYGMYVDVSETLETNIKKIISKLLRHE